ncbi:acyl-CoA thioesterase [Bergeyella zoohelcum]|uniref:YbgC/YbaW family acyl-CoA thioester hydrolase n=1 Tax=Bergeyella zoohelcum ATCC 43767 TaxID=883096 RepID=K1LUL1_9FLAO|nr:thioesterase family protein [Bergeyella zoohelcum]EKB55837.1 YbgC/YbaW family acyl-CoA thioester hydrolase [Bergeyella zoohelcum ATCC 43767]SUV50439.1 Acyl-CoA thioester hydrolase YbgC [Bergeyella zoohelcum]
MIVTSYSFRVRYAEVDSMKFVYYGNYAQYFELGRVELFRKIGISYNEIEKRGIWLPVSEFYVKYIKSARYDDLLTVKTYIRKIPGVRIIFDYELFNEKNELITTASTTLYFFDPERKKIISCPDFLLTLIKDNWK